MWTSDRRKTCRAEEAAAEVGTVTLETQSAGVYLQGERRWASVYGPGGYSWRPSQGEQVLVLKAGTERESPCIVGKRQESALEPGEVSITSGQGKSAIRLGNQGALELTGAVTVNGVALDKVIEAAVKRLTGDE